MPPTPEANPVAGVATASTERNRAVIDKLRSRADTTAKAFATLATTAVTAVGLAKLGDIYPLEEGLSWPLSWPLWLALLGFVLMLLSVAFFTARLWGVTQPIATRTDPDLMTDDLRRGEKSIVEETYNRVARANDTRSLRVYEARANRYARIADSRPKADDATPLRAQSAAMRADITSATTSAAAQLVRRRTNRVVRSFASAFFFFAFAAGVVMFAVASDRLESARAGEIATAKACAEARTANAREDQLPGICGTGGSEGAQVAFAKACADAREANAVEEKLPTSCGDPPDPEPESEPTAESILAAAHSALSDQRAACLAAAKKEGSEPEVCASFNTALAALLK